MRMEVNMFKFTQTLWWEFLKATIFIVAPVVLFILGFILIFSFTPDTTQYTNGLLWILIAMIMWKDK